MRRAALVVALAAAACGDSSRPTVQATSSSIARPTFTCPSTAEVTEAVGRPFGAAPVMSSTASACTYASGDASITLNVALGAGAPAHEQYDQLGPREAVRDLGDDARWSAEQRVLTVLDGDDVVMVLVTGFDDLRAAAVAVARLVVTS